LTGKNLTIMKVLKPAVAGPNPGRGSSKLLSMFRVHFAFPYPLILDTLAWVEIPEAAD
jgi:hypothetical protein